MTLDQSISQGLATLKERYPDEEVGIEIWANRKKQYHNGDEMLIFARIGERDQVAACGDTVDLRKRRRITIGR